jgi:hypothetical protein
VARNIRITTAPTATAATTVARLRDRYPTSPAITGASDSLLLTLIAEATEDVEAYIGRPLSRATYTELLSGNGGEILRLGRAPLESITSIKIDGTLLDAAGYDRVDTKQPNVRRLSAGTPPVGYGVWPIARQAVGEVQGLGVAGLRELLNIEAVYVAGYWLPSMSGSPPTGAHLLPASLEGAVQRLLFDRRQGEALPFGVASIRKGDRDIKFVEGLGMVSGAACADVLDREKVVYE